MDTLSTLQLEMMREERLRRSRQQFEYVRLNLINVGVLSLFALFGLSDGGADNLLVGMLSDKIIFALMTVLALISLTLFLFWMDDAITIAGIDHYFGAIERHHGLEDGVYWYAHREKLNAERVFGLKHWIFNTAVILAFVSPPVFLFLFILLVKAPSLPPVVTLILFGVVLALLLTPFFAWRWYTKRLYG